MKKLFLIGGTMGIGKTETCQYLKKELSNSVFLDGDWCWDANPFQITEETKNMVLSNICYLLNNFIHCSAYQNIIFCWVMHEQGIINSILSRLDTVDCDVKNISLVVDEVNLRNRLMSDISKGVRTIDIVERSVSRIPLYQRLNTIKINTTDKSIKMISDEIMSL